MQAHAVAPLPYLLALATASNIGSTATITGNPQNILIGSISGIPYRDFLGHLGPVASAGPLRRLGTASLDPPAQRQRHRRIPTPKSMNDGQRAEPEMHPAFPMIVSLGRAGRISADFRRRWSPPRAEPFC